MKINKLLYAGAALTLLGACAPAVKAPEAILPVPEEKQVDWQKMETYAFVHFGLNTFNDREWGYGDSEPKTFNPTKLDCEQWVKTFVESGMKGVILTVVGHQFSQLFMEVIYVFRCAVIGLVPVPWREVNSELDAIFLTSGSQLADDVPFSVFIRSIADAILRQLGGPQAETVMMLGGEDHTLHA